MREINRLTKDEDLRQELWLHFLEGNSLFSFEDHLKTVKLKKELITYVDMESIYGIKKNV